MNLDLDKLEQVARAATPGEVTFGALNLCIKTGDHYHVLARCDEGKYDSKEWLTNATFWQAANPAVVLELVRRLRAAEQDAKRYRYLRNPDPQPERELDVCNAGYSIFEGKDLDAAIDRAIAVQGASHD